jgi:hypothetical protein
MHYELVFFDQPRHDSPLTTTGDCVHGDVVKTSVITWTEGCDYELWLSTRGYAQSIQYDDRGEPPLLGLTDAQGYRYRLEIL